jgi:hypothetical protein
LTTIPIAFEERTPPSVTVGEIKFDRSISTSPTSAFRTIDHPVHETTVINNTEQFPSVSVNAHPPPSLGFVRPPVVLKLTTVAAVFSR